MNLDSLLTEEVMYKAGADLQDIAALDAFGARSCRYLEDLCNGVASVQKPVLAAVNGPAVRDKSKESNRELISAIQSPCE